MFEHDVRALHAHLLSSVRVSLLNRLISDDVIRLILLRFEDVWYAVLQDVDLTMRKNVYK